VKPTAWAFAAVSSSPQELSLDSQIAWAKETAKANGWNLSRVIKGVSSGAKGTRKLLDDLLADLRAMPKAERPQRLLLVRIDRLGRGTGLEGIAALAEFKRLGVTLFTRESGEVSPRADPRAERGSRASRAGPSGPRSAPTRNRSEPNRKHP
jgi:DNA invertase Pin-like site-specific DNA recombinase